jgi:hypothetical protein
VIRADLLKLGSSAASSKVALAPEVQSALTTLEAALQAAAAAGGAAATVAAAFTAFAGSLTTSLAAWPPAMAATKVEAE